MAETLPNGTVIPQGADLINSNGVQAMRNLGASVDSQIANRSLVGHTHDDRYYTEDEANNRFSARSATLIPSTADLDTYLTGGTYYQHSNSAATPERNYPATYAGYLDVIGTASDMVRQVYTAYTSGNPKSWIRTYYRGTWGPWIGLTDDYGLTNALKSKSDTGHTHTISGVTGLQVALDEKATTGHTHTISGVTDLQAELDSKATTIHDHDARYYTQAQIDTRLDAISTAYQVAQSEGYTGSIEEWLASLVGPRGPEGPYGGTEVTDPQVASYVTSETETQAALDARYRAHTSVMEYGAVGDGTTDDTAAVQAAINEAAANGRTCTIPAGRYRLTGTVDLPSNTRLKLDSTAVLDVAGVPPASPALRAAGTIAAQRPLLSDAAAGSRAIELSNVDGIAPGAWLKVSSNATFGSTSQPVGEIQRVSAVDGQVLTLSEPLRDTYSVPDAAGVSVVTFCENVSVSGGRMEGDGGSITTLHRGVVIDTCRDVSITDMSFRWVHHIGVWLLDTVSATIHNCRFDEALGPGFGYGAGLSWASQDVSITACHSNRVRHLVTFGGGSARAGIVRRVAVTSCTASQSFDSGLDAHPAAEDFTFTGNVISGSLQDGITVQGGRFVISGNTVTGSVRHGILVQNLTRRGLAGAISGNTIDSSGGAGISTAISSNAAYRNWGGYSLAGNVITGSGTYAIGVENTDSSFRVDGVSVGGNVLRGTGRHALYARGVVGATVGNNHVAGVAGAAEGIYLHTCADSTITGNSVDGGSRNVRVLASPGVTVVGNRGKSATVGLLSDASSAPIAAMGNNFSGSTTSMILAGTGNISSTSDASGAYNL